MEWQRPPNIRERIFGDLLDRIGARSHVPQAALAIRLASVRDNPLAIIIPFDHPLSKERFPKETVWNSVQPGIEQTAVHFQSGDLVIVPESVIQQVLGLQTPELLRASEKISVMVAAGPHRLTLTSSRVGQETESMLNIVKAS